MPVDVFFLVNKKKCKYLPSHSFFPFLLYFFYFVVNIILAVSVAATATATAFKFFIFIHSHFLFSRIYGKSKNSFCCFYFTFDRIAFIAVGVYYIRLICVGILVNPTRQKNASRLKRFACKNNGWIHFNYSWCAYTLAWMKHELKKLQENKSYVFFLPPSAKAHKKQNGEQHIETMDCTRTFYMTEMCHCSTAMYFHIFFSSISNGKQA